MKIIARERTEAEAIVAKYARFPGVVANELKRAQAIVAKYEDADRRAARFERRVLEIADYRAQIYAARTAKLRSR